MFDVGYHCVPKSRWAKTIKELAENKCQFCGSIFDGSLQTRLEAHHIKEKNAFPEIETVIENGIALCHRCHLLAHAGNYQIYLTQNISTNGESRRRLTKNSDVRDFTYRYFDLNMIFSESEYEQLKAAADAVGEAVNTYIKTAIDMRMQKQGKV